MSTVIVVRESSVALAEAVAAAAARARRGAEPPAEPIDAAAAWQALAQALDRSQLTPRQHELVLLDMLGLRRAQIADVMGVTPATLTTYWKAIYDRYGLSGADARAELHRVLFPELPVSTLLARL